MVCFLDCKDFTGVPFSFQMQVGSDGLCFTQVSQSVILIYPEVYKEGYMSTIL